MGKVNDHFVNIHIGEPGKFVSGKNVQVEPFTSILCCNSIVLEDNVTIGPGVTIVDYDHDLTDPKNIKLNGISAPILIKQNVWIGANATILKGVTIGENAVIGAGSVVTHNVGSFEIWAGNPAKCIGRRK